MVVFRHRMPKLRCRSIGVVVVGIGLWVFVVAILTPMTVVNVPPRSNSLRGEASCGELLATHVRWPVSRRLARNGTAVVGTLDEVLDTTLLLSCAAAARRWKRLAEVRGQGESARVRNYESVFRVPSGDCSVEAFLGPDRCGLASVDAVLVPSGPFSRLLGDVDRSLAIAREALIVTGVLEPSATAARAVLTLLRARYDVDVAVVSTFDGGVGVVLKRENSCPLALEALPAKARASIVEWPADGADEASLAALVATSDLMAMVLNVLDAEALFDWLSSDYRPDAARKKRPLVFDPALLPLAVDATRWREDCFDQLDRDLAHAKDCFRAIADLAPFSNRLQRAAPPVVVSQPARRRRAADLVPYALLLAALGDGKSAAGAMTEAARGDAAVTRELFRRAAVASLGGGVGGSPDG